MVRLVLPLIEIPLDVPARPLTVVVLLERFRLRWKPDLPRLTPGARDGGRFPVNVYRLIRLGLKGSRRHLMVKDSDRLRGGFEVEEGGGGLSGLLAEEDEFDRRTL